ncbi:MAG: hypothetical protein MRY74_05955 [Neomegalonema sp.]|nr:hypothetical protein [Neomegalonema sp.]
MSRHPATLRALFEHASFDQDRLKRLLLRKAARPAQSMRRGASEVAQVLHEPVFSALHGALDIRLADVMARGWLSLSELRDAAQLSATGHAYAAPLGRHKLRSEHAPRLDIRLGEELIDRIAAQISLEFTIETMQLIISDGALVALRQGDYSVVGALRVEGEPIAALSDSRFVLEDRAELTRPLKIPH